VHAPILYKGAGRIHCLLFSAFKNLTERDTYAQAKSANPTFHGKMTTSLELLLTLLAAIVAAKDSLLPLHSLPQAQQLSSG